MLKVCFSIAVVLKISKLKNYASTLHRVFEGSIQEAFPVPSYEI